MSDELSTELSKVLMEALSSTSPVFDAADGMRVDLEKRGWSPTAAEQICQHWLMMAMNKIWG